MLRVFFIKVESYVIILENIKFKKKALKKLIAIN